MRREGQIYPQKKTNYIERMHGLLDKYKKIIFVKMQYVSSNHIKSIKQTTSGKAEMIMGKNTLIKKALMTYPKRVERRLDVCIGSIEGCVALVMTNGDVKALKADIEEFSCAPPVKSGSIAISDVDIPAHVTNLSPDKTDFFQNLNIPTRIEKTSIQILNPVKLIKKGERINSSQAALMDLLKMRPFVYRAHCSIVWESGSLYDIGLLDLTTEEMLEVAKEAVQNILSVSMGIGVVNSYTLGHSVRSVMNRVLSVSLGAEVENSLTKSFHQAADEAAKFIASGGVLPSSQAAATQSQKDSSSGQKPAETKPVEQPKEESSDEGFGLDDLF